MADGPNVLFLPNERKGAGAFFWFRLYSERTPFCVGLQKWLAASLPIGDKTAALN